MTWWWRRRNGYEAKAARAEAEAHLRRAEADTSAVHRWADRLADLDRDELVDRITAAFNPDR